MLIIATYLSFAAGFWYAARGTAASLPILSNEIGAALVGGIIPFVLFELVLRFYLRPLVRLGLPDLPRSIMRLRLYFIAANLVCFAASFIYFKYPFLSIWGEILLNFIILFAALIVYLIFEVRRLTDKSKAAPFALQIGTVFLFVYGVMTALSVVLELI